MLSILYHIIGLQGKIELQKPDPYSSISVSFTEHKEDIVIKN